MRFKNSIPALNHGDKIRIIAPGMAFDRGELKASTKVLTSWGYSVHQPKNLLGSHPVSANSEVARWEHLKSALESDARIIWAARGGYGSLHLLRYLKSYRPKNTSAKLLIGFSDITTLHQYFNQKWGWISWHGPHADRLHRLNDERQTELRKIINGSIDTLEFRLKPLNKKAQAAKSIRGSVVGGNLVTTQSTFGTDWQIDVQNKIVFLEDIGERGYRVDRVLEHMMYLGVLQKARAVVFGPFVGGEEPNGKKSKVPKVLKAIAEKLPCPVFSGIDSGHIANSRTLPLNTMSEITKYKISVSTGIL